jgi:hypothetical protein
MTRGWKERVQQLQPFRQHVFPQLGRARDIAARLVKAGDEAKFDRVSGRFKNDRDGHCRRLCRECPWRASRGNRCHLTMNQIGRKRWHAIVVMPGSTVVDAAF